MTKLQESLNDNRMVQKCIDTIRTFNPVTHSIDTHIADKIGDISRPVSAKYYNMRLVNFVFTASLIKIQNSFFRKQIQVMFLFNKCCMAGIEKKKSLT